MAITRREFAYGVLASLFSRDPLQAASEILEQATSPGWFSAPDINAALLDVCFGTKRYTKAYGAAGTPERVFIIASISKPIVATGAMVLRDRGKLALRDRVVKFVPEFHGEGRDDVTIQNLLTHTAGLPDSVPEIRQLLARQAGLSEIFAATCNVPLNCILLFEPWCFGDERNHRTNHWCVLEPVPQDRSICTAGDERNFARLRRARHRIHGTKPAKTRRTQSQYPLPWRPGCPLGRSLLDRT